MNKLNYPNWLVPLYIAKELREIGFREKTFTYFEINTDGEDRYFTPTDINFKELQIYNRYRDYVSIPTWEQVFAWFREKGYESYIRLESHSHFDEGNYYYFEITKPNLYRINQLDWQGDFDDYNEVQEALVKALIRTYKQEQLK